MADQWADIESTVNGDFEKVPRAASIVMENRIVEMSPVDKGRFRSNWNAWIGDLTEGEQAKSERLLVTKSLQTGQVLGFTNNLPYALPLEFGHSKEQAPNGMVGVTVANWQVVVDRMIKGLKK